MNLLSTVKSKILIRHMIIPQELLYWNQFTRNNFGTPPISMAYDSPIEPRIDYVVMFLASSGTGQDLHKNTSKYGVWEYTSSMDVLQ